MCSSYVTPLRAREKNLVFFTSLMSFLLCLNFLSWVPPFSKILPGFPIPAPSNVWGGFAAMAWYGIPFLGLTLAGAVFLVLIPNRHGIRSLLHPLVLLSFILLLPSICLWLYVFVLSQLRDTLRQ